MEIKRQESRFSIAARLGLVAAPLAGLLGLLLGLAVSADAQDPGVVVEAFPATVIANGLTTATITVTVMGVPESSVVTITTSAGYLGNWQRTVTGTTSSGVVSTILTSAPSSVTVAIALTATVSGESGYGSVTFQAVSCRENLWDWREYDHNPVFDPAQTVYYPTVIYRADAFGQRQGDVISASLPYTYVVPPYYKMWTARSNADRGLQFVYSGDGLTWHQFNAGAQLPGLALNGYHSLVLYDADAFGGSGYFYRIWYWNPDQPLTSINAFRTARSADGISWVNDQALTQSVTMPLVSGVDGTYWYHTYGPAAVLYNPAGPGTPDSGHPLDNRYVMYYSASGEGFAPDGNDEATGLAYSADGIAWTRYGDEPVLSVGPAGAWDHKYAVAYSAVLRGPDSFYHMWYSGGITRVQEGIGYAVSADGVRWSKSLNNPIFHIYDGVPTRTSRTYTPLVLYDANGFSGHGPAAPYKMWFTGDDGSNRTIHFAMLQPAITLSYVSGSGQMENIGGALANPFVVRTANTCGDPAPGASVSFSITGWPDTATVSGTLSVTNTVTTANGQAASILTLGNANGVYTVTTQSAGLSGSLVVFTATAPTAADVRVSKQAEPPSATPGQAITYTLAFSNAGPGLATGVVITDIVPVGQVANLSYGASIPITLTGSVSYTWQVGSLAPGASGVITITGVVSPEISGSVIIVNTATITTTTPDSNTSNNTGQAVLVVTRYQVYLPLALKSYISAPDLVVECIIATSNSVQVVIKNQGSALVIDEFWVDAYINPSPAPTHVNQMWDQLGSQGLVWGVTALALPKLTPDGTLTLTVGDDYYDPIRSRVSWPLAAGMRVYAQADSWNSDTTYGAVLESHEISSGAYNNITGAVSTSDVMSAVLPPDDAKTRPVSPCRAGCD